MRSCTLKKTSQLEFESRGLFSEYFADNEWLEVVLDEDTLKTTHGSGVLLAEDAGDKK